MRVMFAVLALLAFAHAAVITPKFLWGQDTNTITLTVKVKCGDDHPYSVEKDKFAFSCTDDAGSTYQLDMTLREDARAVSCAFRSDVLCMVKKELPGLWDRLVHSEKEQARLKPFMSVDWGRFEERSDEEAEDLIADHLGSSKTIIKLTDATFEAVKAKNDLIALYAGFPWCAPCSYMMKSFLQASRDMKDAAVLFARAETRTERDIRHALNVTCGDCGIWLLKRGEEPQFVKRLQFPHDVVKAITPYIGDAVADATAAGDALTTLREAHRDGLAVGYFAAAKGEDYDDFMEAAKQLRGVVKFVAQFGTSHPAGSVLVHSTARNGSDARVPDIASVGDLAKTIRSLSLGPLPSYNYKDSEKVQAVGPPFGHVYVSDNPTAEQLAPFREVSDRFRGRVQFFTLGANFHRNLVTGGLSSATMPQFAITNGVMLAEQVPIYAYDGDCADVEELASFVERALSGNVTAAVKSEQVKPWSPGEVMTMVAHNARDSLFNGSDVFFVVYLSSISEKWYNDRIATFKEVARVLRTVPRTVVATYDATVNKFPWPEVFIGLPELTEATAFLFRPGLSGLKYTGAFKAEKILSFLEENSNAVKSAPDEVAAGRQRLQDELKAEKEAAEAKKRELEAKFASYERVSVKDEDIVKFIVTAGTGPTPQIGDEISAHYTGRLVETDEKFDSSVDRNEAFKFKLAKGQVIKCWDEGFATMKVGEKAILQCASKYAYGDFGSPPKIPPKAALRFEVELLAINGVGAPAHTDL